MFAYFQTSLKFVTKLKYLTTASFKFCYEWLFTDKLNLFKLTFIKYNCLFTNIIIIQILRTKQTVILNLTKRIKLFVLSFSYRKIY